MAATPTMSTSAPSTTNTTAAAHYADPHAGVDNTAPVPPPIALVRTSTHTVDATGLQHQQPELHEGNHSMTTAFAFTPPDAITTHDAATDSKDINGHGESSKKDTMNGEDAAVTRAMRTDRSTLPLALPPTGSFRQREEEDEAAQVISNNTLLLNFTPNTGSNVFTRSMYQPLSRATRPNTAQPSFASPSAAAVTIVPLPAEANIPVKEIHTRTGRRVHHHHHSHKKKNNEENKSSGSGSSSSSSDSDSEDEEDKTNGRRDDAERIRRLFARHVVRNYIFLWLLGVINNFHYNLVISAANELAAGYGMKQYVAVISFVNVFFGIFARLMNAFVAHRISYNIRMTIMPCSTLLGLLLIALSGPIGHGNGVASFLIVLLGVSFSGTAYSYGETVALTYVQRYPAKMVGAWGSGTGTSGVIASLLFIILTSAGLSKQRIFFISMPLALVYWLTFIFGLLAPHKVVTLRYLDQLDRSGQPRTRRIVLHRGVEDEMLASLKAQASPTLEVSEYEIVMLNNLRGLAWRTLPKATPMPVRRPPKKPRLTKKKIKASKKEAGKEEKKKTKTKKTHHNNNENDERGIHIHHHHTKRHHHRHDDDIAVTQVDILPSINTTTTHERVLLGMESGQEDDTAMTPPVAAVCTPRSEDPMYYYARSHYGIDLDDGDDNENDNIYNTIEMHGEERDAERRRNANSNRVHHAAAAEVYYSPTGPNPHTTTFTGAAIPNEHDAQTLNLQDSVEYTDAMRSRFCRGLFACCKVDNTLRRWWVINGPVILLMHHAMIWFLFNLAIVYIAGYAAQFMAPFSFFCQSDWNKSFWLKNSYTITQLCYQVGVLISRSSLPCIKIPAVGVLSILQIVNAIGWFVQAKVRFIASKHHRNSQVGLSFLLFVWMIFVGLVGGASYVNVFYLVLRKSDAMQQADVAATLVSFLRKRGYTPITTTTTEQHKSGMSNTAAVITTTNGSGGDSSQHVEMLPRTETPTALAAAPFSPAVSSSSPRANSNTASASLKKANKADTVVGQPAPSESSSSSSSSSEDDENNNNNIVAERDTILVSVAGSEYRLHYKDAEDLKDLQHHLADEWQRRRELAMSIGALYAMVGICIGTAVDVVFTNTVLKSNTNSCTG